MAAPATWSLGLLGLVATVVMLAAGFPAWSAPLVIWSTLFIALASAPPRRTPPDHLKGARRTNTNLYCCFGVSCLIALQWTLAGWVGVGIVLGLSATLSIGIHLARSHSNL
jgi:hypothetical protein